MPFYVVSFLVYNVTPFIYLPWISRALLRKHAFTNCLMCGFLSSRMDANLAPSDVTINNHGGQHACPRKLAIEWCDLWGRQLLTINNKTWWNMIHLANTVAAEGSCLPMRKKLRCFRSILLVYNVRLHVLQAYSAKMHPAEKYATTLYIEWSMQPLILFLLIDTRIPD